MATEEINTTYWKRAWHDFSLCGQTCTDGKYGTVVRNDSVKARYILQQAKIVCKLRGGKENTGLESWEQFVLRFLPDVVRTSNTEFECRELGIISVDQYQDPV